MSTESAGSALGAVRHGLESSAEVDPEGESSCSVFERPRSHGRFVWMTAMRWLLMLLVPLSLLPDGAAARQRDLGVWATGGPTLVVGEASDFLDGGWGGGLGIGLPLFSGLAFRGEGRFVRLAEDRDPGGSATNAVLSMTGGIEAELGQWWLRPWVWSGWGMFANRARTRVAGHSSGYTDWTTGVVFGAGIRLRPAAQFAITVGIDVARPGVLDFGRYDGAPPGATRVRTDPAFLSIQAGVRWYPGAGRTR